MKRKKLLLVSIFIINCLFLISCNTPEDNSSDSVITETSSIEEIEEQTKGSISEPYVAGEVATFDFYGQVPSTNADLTGTAQFEIIGYTKKGDYTFISFESSIIDCTYSGQLDYGHYFNVYFIDENYQVIEKGCFVKPFDDVFDWQSLILFPGGSAEAGVWTYENDMNPKYICINYCKPENSETYVLSLNDYPQTQYSDSIWFEIP